MKKIINWSFGSFFRTIGRVFAYLCIGILILIIGSILGSKLPINRFIKVNAEELVVPVNYIREQQHNIDYTNSPGFEKSTTNSLITLRSITSTNDNSIKEYKITFNTTNIDYTNISYIEIPFSFSKPLIFNTNDDTETYFCEQWTLDTDTNTYNCTQKLQYYNKALVENDTADVTINNFYIQMVYTDNTWNTCSLNNSNNIICNVNGKVPKQLYFYINFKTHKTTNFLIAISRVFKLYSSATQEQINSINNVNDSINNVNDSINNDNVDDSTNSASGFFSDFTNNDHGLSGIVTAPLNAVNAMLSNQCVAPSGTYKGKTFSFPCGNILWDKDTTGQFKLFINLIYGGFLCFGIVKSLFKDVNNLKNPDNDKVEVIDL